MYALIFFDTGWMSVEVNDCDDLTYYPDRTLAVHGAASSWRINMDKVKMVCVADTEELADDLVRTLG